MKISQKHWSDMEMSQKPDNDEIEISLYVMCCGVDISQFSCVLWTLATL